MKTIVFGKPDHWDRPNSPEALNARMAVAQATIAACNASTAKSVRLTILLSLISIGASAVALLCSGLVIAHRSGWL